MRNGGFCFFCDWDVGVWHVSTVGVRMGSGWCLGGRAGV